MSMNKAPCQGCKMRAAKCHSKCEPYKEYTEKRKEEIHKLILNDKIVNTILPEHR